MRSVCAASLIGKGRYDAERRRDGPFVVPLSVALVELLLHLRVGTRREVIAGGVVVVVGGTKLLRVRVRVRARVRARARVRVGVACWTRPGSGLGLGVRVRVRVRG